MLRRSRLLLSLPVLLWILAPSAAAQSGTAEQQVVEQFLDAYNRHDIGGMLALAHPDVQWLSVAGDSIATEVVGSDALRESLTRYFASLPSSRSTAERVMAAGRFISVWERAHWQSKNGRARTQSSLAVYEVDQGRIRRIWYFPVQP